MPRKQIPADRLLEFFELEPFSRRWDRFDFPVEELGNLQIEIMADPAHHPVIQGTHGLRKMRYAPVSWQRGKSGALRVCYVYFPRWQVVLLAAVYAKSESDNIPPAMKAPINAAIDEIEVQLDRLFTKGSRRGKGKRKR